MKAMVACKKSLHQYPAATWPRQFQRQFHQGESPRPPSGVQLLTGQSPACVELHGRQDGSAARHSSAVGADDIHVELGYITTPALISHDDPT